VANALSRRMPPRFSPAECGRDEARVGLSHRASVLSLCPTLSILLATPGVPNETAHLGRVQQKSTQLCGWLTGSTLIRCVGISRAAGASVVKQWTAQQTGMTLSDSPNSAVRSRANRDRLGS
jgi:hypothetical protein